MKMTSEEAKSLVASVKHWHHAFEIAPGVRTPGSYDPSILWQRMKEACKWHGLRVLDVGPADGAMSMWAANAGASVTALDFRPKHDSGFATMEEISGHRFGFHIGNILDAPDLGKFDVVFFLGVLYHLPDPIRGLWACRKFCRTGAKLFLETWFAPELDQDTPLVKYLPHGSYRDWTNFWVPNRSALLVMLGDAGFEVVRDDSWGARIFVEATAIDDAEKSRRMNISYATNIAGR
jgi:tRNA (mo5U34)-methyltransferase